MARDFIGAWLREVKRAEREAIRAQKAAERERKAFEREADKARKDEERLQKRLMKAAAAERKQLEKKAKEAHVASMLAQVDSLNAQLQSSATIKRTPIFISRKSEPVRSALLRTCRYY